MARPDDELPASSSEDVARRLVEPLLASFPHDFELRPGETVEIDSEQAEAAANRFREVLGRFASGIAVVTTTTDSGPTGMTCQSFTSVSLDPPLVAFLPTRQSRAFAAIRRSGHFCVNVLAADQAWLSDQMASPGPVDKFAGVDWDTGTTGSPRLHGALAHVDCTVRAVHEAGDHYIVVGEVVDLGAPGDPADPDPRAEPAAGAGPLLYYRGRYTTVAD
jgi:3-hydroxy-9,10-secoandrosta-1,3,5(10)-triene-9,17-dione monooxygenase reductase component